MFFVFVLFLVVVVVWHMVSLVMRMNGRPCATRNIVIEERKRRQMAPG